MTTPKNERKRRIREINGDTLFPGLGRSPINYLLALVIQNVRCFGRRRQTLKLTDPGGRLARWTLLLGNNGTGKTTLLQSLAALVADPRRQPAGGRAKDSSPVPAVAGRTWPARARWLPMRSPEQPAYLRLSHCEGCDLTSKVVRSQILHSGVEFTRSGGMIEVGAPRIDCYGYGPTRRLSPPTVTEADTDDPCASLFSENADLRNAEEWLLRLDYSASKPSKIKTAQRARLARVKRILCDLLPDVPDIEITEPTKQSPTPTARFKTPYGWVPLRDLGHGYQSLVAWVVDFASRMVDRHPGSEDPLAEPAVVLIDELDLHLHPSWQRKVMSHLTERFPGTQFIASAHSPLIVQAAEDANVVLLKREGDHVIIENNVEAIQGWRLDQILTSDLYDLPTARPPRFEAMLARRKALLTKSRLSAREKKELMGLNTEIGDLPFGETATEAKKLREAVEITRALLEKYKD